MITKNKMYIQIYVLLLTDNNCNSSCMDRLNCHFLLQSSSRIFFLIFFSCDCPFSSFPLHLCSSLFLPKATFSMKALPWKSNRQEDSFSWSLLAFELQVGWQWIPKSTATTCHTAADGNKKIIWQQASTLNVEINLHNMEAGNGKQFQNNFWPYETIQYETLWKLEMENNFKTILTFTWNIWDYYYSTFQHFVWNQFPCAC